MGGLFVGNLNRHFVAPDQFLNQALRIHLTFAQLSFQKAFAVVRPVKVEQFRNYALPWAKSDA